MYTYQEAYNESLKYFNGDELAAKVVCDKYLLRDREDNLLELSPLDIHKRLAKEFARIEKGKFKEPLSEEEIFNYLDKYRYICLQGSPTFGIGNQYQYVSLGNCFVISPPFDSYLGIVHTDMEITQLTARRAGVGWDISKLRPKNALVKNAARSTSGAVSFMERFSNTIREVGMHGRRGASLQSLAVNHPDILDFIKCKRDLTKITGSNISVKFTDDFFNKLNNDEEIELCWPVCKEDADEMNLPFPTIKRKIKASEIWNEFIKGARDYAEPGAIYWDTVISESTTAPYKQFGFIETAPNPCQPGWAKVLTPDGVQNLNEIYPGHKIWSVEGWTTVINKVQTGIKKVFKYITTAGIFYGTENHRVVTSLGKQEVNLAKNINIIKGPILKNSRIIPKYVMDGLVIGDGSVHKASNDLIHLYIGENDKNYFTSEIKHLIKKHRPGIKDTAYEIETSIQKNELDLTYNRKIPDRFLFGDKDKICSFLRGLYSANGSVCDNRITLKSSSFKIIEDVQLMLSSIGIRSYWTKNNSKNVKFINGNYVCKENYDLNISTDRELFVKLIGFIQDYKNEKIKITNSSKTKEFYEIISVKEIGEEYVYDITVDNSSHTYWTQCCNISNCGEQYLPKNSSCRLLLVNLYSFVKNKFLKNSSFDWNKFKETVRILQRLGDDLVDLELEAIDRIINKIKSDPEPDYIKKPGIDLWEKIKDTAIKDRRTGCGLTGLADCIAALNIKYDSDESVNFIEEMQKTFKLEAYKSSVEMAKELGPFPLYDYELDKNSDFIKRIKEEDNELYEEMKKYGRRNMTLLTIAPTGSVSILTQTSSGLEPVFMLSYIRRKKGNLGDIGFTKDFTDQNGDHWMHFNVYHKGLKDWMEITGKTDIKQSPYWGCEAEQINWEKRIDIQAVLQRNIDNSVSTTLNLSENVTNEEVSNIYLTAWKKKCKGCTVYRKNCRSGVIIEKHTKITENAQKRKKELDCDVFSGKIYKEDHFILVGLLDNEPYEIFLGKGKFNIEKGKIRKISKGHYSLINHKDDVVCDNICGKIGHDEETTTRMISTSLRHKIPLEFILQQLTKTDGPLHSTYKVIARCLKKYIKDGTKTGDSCPNCSEQLIFSEGCHKCLNPECGYSKCG